MTLEERVEELYRQGTIALAMKDDVLAALRAVRVEALEEVRIATVRALRDFNPGGCWNWEGYEQEAVETVEAAIRALAAGERGEGCTEG